MIKITNVIKSNYKQAYKYAQEMLNKYPHRDVEIYFKKNKKGKGGKYYFKLPLKSKRRIKNQLISKPYSMFRK